MTKANVLNGWKSPDEKPTNNGGDVLFVFRSIESGNIFIVALHRYDIEELRNDNHYELLAWQYCPVWEKE